MQLQSSIGSGTADIAVAQLDGAPSERHARRTRPARVRGRRADQPSGQRRSPCSELTNGELVEACRAGRTDAWRELDRRFSPRLRMIGRSCGLDAASADDVVQTTWSRLLRHLDRILDAEAIGGWLSTVARREAIRVSRERRRLQRWPLEDEIPGTDVTPADERILRTERAAWVRHGLARLAESDRRLLRLLFDGDELSYAEVAARVGRPVGSLGPTRARALARLHALLPQEASA